MGKIYEQTPQQRRYTDDNYAHEKLFNLVCD